MTKEQIKQVRELATRAHTDISYAQMVVMMAATKIRDLKGLMDRDEPKDDCDAMMEHLAIAESETRSALTIIVGWEYPPFCLDEDQP